MDDTNESDYTVAVCRCGNAVFAGATYRLDRKDKNLLGRFAASGHDIRHMPIEQVRQTKFICTCPKAKKGDR